MKKITLLSTLCFLLLTLVVNAQTPPNAFNYSAVARNAAGQPIATATIGIQITILKTSPTGASQYSENHFVNTDAFGLFNLVIGAGAVQSGSMATIDWSNDNYYLKVGMDATGGTNFLTMGTTQLLSVPYALHAKTAETVTGGGSSNDFYLGQDTLGGIVFYVYNGNDGQQKGLIVSKTETTGQWQSSFSFLGATSMWDGYSNTLLMTNSPIKTWVTTNFSSEWYIPSINELQILSQNIFHVNKAISAGGLTPLPFGQQVTTDYYWSSTEKIDEIQYSGDENNAYNFGIPQNYNYILGLEKGSVLKVRAIRQF
jgi:hypothetical protein